MGPNPQSNIMEYVSESDDQSDFQSESFMTEEVESCNSFGKSSIVYNEESKVIFNRFQKFFQFRNIKETAKKQAMAKKQKRQMQQQRKMKGAPIDDNCVAMGQYYFPFTL